MYYKFLSIIDETEAIAWYFIDENKSISVNENGIVIYSYQFEKDELVECSKEEYTTALKTAISNIINEVL